jgi:dynactin 1
MTDNLRVGQVIEDADGRTSIIRYIGSITGAKGDYIGVELGEAIGKNDGSAKGQRYFECAPNYGLFMRSSAVLRILHESAAVPTSNMRSRGELSSSMTNDRDRAKLQTDTSVPRRLTLTTASPIPSASLQTTKAEPRDPTAQPALGRSRRSTSVTSATSSRAPTPIDRRFPVRPAVPSRTSGLHSRTTSVSSHASVQVLRQHNSTASVNAPNQRNPSAVSEQVSDNGVHSTRSHTIETNAQKHIDTTAAFARNGDLSETASADDDTGSQYSVSSSLAGNDVNIPGDDIDQTPRARRTGQAQSIQAPSMSVSAEVMKIGRNREIEALEAKIRIIERKRAQDRDKLKTLEKLQTERDRFENVVNKLQAKLQPQQQDLAELRRQLKESHAKLAEIEDTQIDHDSALEMATLDREVAEESAEALRTDLDSLKLRAEELEEEVKLLREENEELGKDVNETDRTSQGWLHLEKSNERLKEALVRLRDVTQAQEAELKNELKSVKDELKRLSAIEEQYNKIKAQLAQSDAIIDDLKQQLELAEGADGMIEELTEKNLTLTEQVEGLRTAVEDLESLKELNDELEFGHVEAEKQLQEELDRRDTMLLDYEKHSSQQRQKIVDYETTITKFRQLVASLQAHLEDIIASKDLTEAEAEELNMQARTLMELNSKLKNAASRTQVNAVELEMARFRAEQTVEHLELVRLFLLDDVKAPMEILDVLSGLRSTAFKAGLLHSLITEAHGPSANLQVHIVQYCDLRDKLLAVRSGCEKIMDFIRSCSTEELTWCRTGLRSLLPAEQTIDIHVHHATKENLRLADMHNDIAGYVVAMEDIQLHIGGGAPRDNQDVDSNITALLSRLDITDTLLISLQSISVSPTGREQHSLDSIIKAIHQSKNHASKTLAIINDLKSRQQGLNSEAAQDLEECSAACFALFSNSKSLALAHQQKHAVNEHDEVNSTGHSDHDIDIFGRIESLGVQISTLESRLATLHIRLTISPLPVVPLPDPTSSFVELAAQLRSSRDAKSSSSSDTGTIPDGLDTTARSEEANRSLHAAVALTAEQQLKISILETRMHDASAKAARLGEVENSLVAARNRETELVKQLNDAEAEILQLQQTMQLWKEEREERAKKDEEDSEKQRAEEEKRQIEGSEGLGAAGMAQLEALRAQVGGLQGAVRFLRQEDARRRYQSHSTSEHDDLDWLKQPLIPPIADRAAEEKRQECLKRGRVLFEDFVDIVCNARMVSVKASSAGGEAEDGKVERLKWRPLRQKTAWVNARQREVWEKWVSRADRYVKNSA